MLQYPLGAADTDAFPSLGVGIQRFQCLDDLLHPAFAPAVGANAGRFGHGVLSSESDASVSVDQIPTNATFSTSSYSA